MTLAPVEIRHVKPGRRPLGYDRGAVDRLLEQIAESFEQVWRERADLSDQIERLESELARHKDLEALLRNTLVTAERSADELKAQARREAELIVEEARVKAREVASAAESECERLKGEIRRLRGVEAQMRADYRAFLLGALERSERDADERRAPGHAA